jgi:hypothetical protein
MEAQNIFESLEQSYRDANYIRYYFYRRGYLPDYLKTVNKITEVNNNYLPSLFKNLSNFLLELFHTHLKIDSSIPDNIKLVKEMLDGFDWVFYDKCYLFSKDDDYDEDIDIIKLKEILKEKVIEKLKPYTKDIPFTLLPKIIQRETCLSKEEDKYWDYYNMLTWENKVLNNIYEDSGDGKIIFTEIGKILRFIRMFILDNDVVARVSLSSIYEFTLVK